MKRRTLAMWGVILAAMSMVVLFQTPAQASTSCKSFGKHWGLSESPVPANIAYTDFHFEICTDGRSITTSTASASSDLTAFGKATGYAISLHVPYRTSFSSGDNTHMGGGGLNSKGSVQECEPFKITVFCSLADNYSEHVSFVMYAGAAPPVSIRAPGTFALHNRLFRVSITHACNKNCGIRFH
jgi:hypothetical protein